MPTDLPARARPRERVLVLMLVLAALYGASYQQFRHFDFFHPGGMSDSESYVAMAQGNWNVDQLHRYRFAIPIAAGALCRAVSRCDLTGLLLAFYVVNTCVMAATAMLLHELLRRLGFRPLLRLLGVLLFIASRVTVYSAAVPLVDALYYLAVVAICLLLAARRFWSLLALFPALALAKETVLPFLFLPWLVPGFARDARRGLAWGASLLGSLAGMALVRRHIDSLAGAHAETFATIVASHVAAVPEALARLASLRGLHDLQHGFSFLLPIAVAGYVLDRRERRYDIPRWLLAPAGIAMVLALVSGNLGRMLFPAVVCVIPYALVLIDGILGTEAGRIESS